jgi:hypothetical protein
MSDRWYYQLLMEEFGPVSQEYIFEQLACGTLGEGDLVRSEAGGDWMLISAMKETCQVSDPSESTLEEIQDLSELNFKFETSNSAPPRPTAVNAPVPLPRSDAAVVSKPSALERDSKREVRAEAPPVRKRKPAPVEANQAAPILQEQKPNVASVKQKRVASVKETSKAGRSKRISSNGTAVEDELPDDVFSDVFQKQDSASQRSLSTTASMATTPTSAGFASTSASRTAMVTSPLIPSPTSNAAGTSPSSTPVTTPYSA